VDLCAAPVARLLNHVRRSDRGGSRTADGIEFCNADLSQLLSPSVTSRPTRGDALTIDLVVGYNRANTSPILKLFLSRMDELIARVSKKIEEA
jgi:hypothetical protein